MPLACQPESNAPLYFTCAREDMEIAHTDSVETFLRKVRAFSLVGEYARLHQGRNECRIVRAVRVENPLVREMSGADVKEGVLLTYAGTQALIKWHGEILEVETAEANDLQEGSLADSF